MWVGFRMRVIAEGGLEAFQRAVSETAGGKAANRRNEAKMFETDRIEDERVGDERISDERIEADRLDRMSLGEVLYFALFGEGMQAV